MVRIFLLGVAACLAASPALSQTPSQTPARPPAAPPAPAAAGAAATPVPAPTPALTPPRDYVIGPDDVLSVVFWREKELSADAVVRPDGKISLPLLNEIDAVGLTPEQLRVKLTEAASKLIEDPTVAVVVKEIKSRKVFITGQVNKPGPYPLLVPTTVMQLIAMAGGLLEFADSKNIVILRSENGKQVSLRFNYQDLANRRNLAQNIELRLGDTLIVP